MGVATLSEQTHNQSQDVVPGMTTAGYLGSLVAALLLVCFLYAIGELAEDYQRASALGIPFASGHSHNNEQVTGGLIAALHQGFCSIEADSFAVDGKLLVGHDLHKLREDRSLQGSGGSCRRNTSPAPDRNPHDINLKVLYLDPLAALVKANGGLVYPRSRYLGTCRSVTLMIDVKEVPGQSAEASYAAIHTVLSQYAAKHPGLLASWERGSGAVTRGALTVMISGDRPSAAHMLSDAYPVRYAILDGREADLDGDLPVSLVPLISKAWEGGLDPLHLSREHQQAAEGLIRRGHAQGRNVRFWGTLDTPQQWQQLFDMGVDVISTDDLAGLRAFVAMRASQRGAPLRPLPSTLSVVVGQVFGRRFGAKEEGD